MPDINISSLFGGGKSRSLNFIHAKTDPIAASLEIVINYGLIVAAVIMVIAWITCGVEYYLRGQLNDQGHKVQTLGEEVDQKMSQLVGGNPADPKTQFTFESKFLATQQKLDRYEQLRDDEKMVDLFGILAAIMPDGVRMTSLTVQPHYVEVVFFISETDKDQAIRDFASNLLAINNSTFLDGKHLNIQDPEIPEIVMATDQGGMGYSATVSFTYSITADEIIPETETELS